VFFVETAVLTRAGSRRSKLLVIRQTYWKGGVKAKSVLPYSVHSASTGSSTIKTLPLPVSLSARTLPP
jgi:hypothetical protein